MENIPTQQAPSLSEIPSPPKSKKWLATLLAIMIIVFLAGTAGFLFYQNRELKRISKAPLPTPSLILSPRTEEEIKIIDGSIYRINPSGETDLLVNKKDPNFKIDYIQGFTDVKVSPDKSKICFIGWPPAPTPTLYYTNLVSTETIQIGGAKNCFWSPDSQKIAHNDHATDISPINILVYDILSEETKNLTENAAQERHIRYYESPHWIDEKSLFGSFVSVEMPEEKIKLEGTSTINVLTEEITEHINFSCQSTALD